MALAISEEHRELSASVAGVLRDRGALQEAHAALDGTLTASAAHWKDAVDLGWPGLHVEERFGGSGAGLPEAVLVLEQAGAQVAPGPLLPTMLAAGVLQAAATDEVRAALLPRMVAGELSVGVDLGGGVRLEDGLLHGNADLVLGAGDDLLLLRVGEDVAVVDDMAAIEVRVVPDRFDASLEIVAVRCTGARPLAVMPGAARTVRRLGWLFGAAQGAGIIAAVLRASVAYVGVREQFGRPVGSFQAVKHHCADLLLAAELATAAVWDAARTSSEGDEAELTAAVAAVLGLTPAVRAAQKAIQLHGGIGYTWEHDAHLYLRRAAALDALLGSSDAAAARVQELRAAGTVRRASVDLPQAEAEGHRADARAFLAAWRAAPEADRQQLAARAGYVVPHWPRPYGRGGDPVEQVVIDEELGELPRQSLGLGEWVLPTILQHGTDEQRDRYLWPSLEGQLRWCQLFSESGAGSDAAAVSTRARRTDGGWLVTGQKVWTSDARNCQRGLATVRTNTEAPKHRGITAMVIDMHAKGVEVRPLTEITGEALFNEVFLDDVFVPDSDVVGAVDGGWRVARATLANERLSIGGNPVTVEAHELLPLAQRYGADDTGTRRDVGRLLSEAQGLHALNLQQVERALSGAEPGVEGGVAKLVGGEHAQRVVDLGLRIAGPAAVLGLEPTWSRDFLFTRCLTIAGGTSEVVRNQLAEAVLGLPREPKG